MSQTTWMTKRLGVGLIVLLLFLAAGCGGARSSSPSAQSRIAGARAGELREDVGAQMSVAMTALAGQDEAAWRAATPAAATVRDHFDDVYEHLAPLRLGRLQAHVHVVPRTHDVFDVQITGRTGAAGPPDRLVAELLVRAATSRKAWKQVVPAPSPLPAPGARVAFVEDRTPPKVAVEYFMAFIHPGRLDTPGCVAIYERAWRLRAASLAGLVKGASDRVRQHYGIRDGRPIALFVYGTRDQARDALGLYPSGIDSRLRYYTGSPCRLAARPWPLGDVSVVAPALNGVEAWAPVMLQHEVAHAYTFAWFRGLAHRPDFLAEGLAVAVQQSQDYSLLKQALATGAPKFSLGDAIALGDIWGNDDDATHLGYQAGGATVGLVLRDWGRARLKRWVRAVADSDLSAAAITRATRDELGVSWTVFQRRWRAYVQTL